MCTAESPETESRPSTTSILLLSFPVISSLNLIAVYPFVRGGVYRKTYLHVTAPIDSNTIEQFGHSKLDQNTQPTCRREACLHHPERLTGRRRKTELPSSACQGRQLHVSSGQRRTSTVSLKTHPTVPLPYQPAA